MNERNASEKERASELADALEQAAKIGAIAAHILDGRSVETMGEKIDCVAFSPATHVALDKDDEALDIQVGIPECLHPDRQPPAYCEIVDFSGNRIDGATCSHQVRNHDPNADDIVRRMNAENKEKVDLHDIF